MEDDLAFGRDSMDSGDMPARDDPQRETTSNQKDRVVPRSPSAAIEPQPAPPPPKGRSRSRPGLVFVGNLLIAFIILAAVCVFAFSYFGYRQFVSAGPLEKAQTMLIAPGTGVSAIARKLHSANIISDYVLFVAATAITGSGSQLKAGEYLFTEQMSMRDVLSALVSGKAIIYKVTVVEGRTSQQVVELLQRQDKLTGDITAIPAEGSLLPETYLFSRGDTRQELLTRMQEAMRDRVRMVWQNRAPDLPLETPEQLVTLASIIEKETGVAAERPRVAAVFVNRLRKGMPLQSDPTIVYGIVGGAGALGRPIRRSEIDTHTAYNTYQINGLPPGPIANPGVAAIESAAHPAETDDLYFVADGSGGHQFAVTLAEHNRNVARWRKIRREMDANRAKNKQSATENSDDLTNSIDVTPVTPPQLNLDLRPAGL